MTHKEKDKLIEELREEIEMDNFSIDRFITILEMEGLLSKYFDEDGDFLPGVEDMLEEYKIQVVKYEAQKPHQRLERWVKSGKIKEAIAKNGMFYAEYAGFNGEFEEMGHICPYEYCIETQELTEESTGLSCPLFGHNCPDPDGEVQVALCKKANGIE